MICEWRYVEVEGIQEAYHTICRLCGGECDVEVRAKNLQRNRMREKGEFWSTGAMWQG